MSYQQEADLNIDIDSLAEQRIKWCLGMVCLSFLHRDWSKYCVQQWKIKRRLQGKEKRTAERINTLLSRPFHMHMQIIYSDQR